MDIPNHSDSAGEGGCGIIPLNDFADRNLEVGECSLDNREILIIKLKIRIRYVVILNLTDDSSISSLLLLKEKGIQLDVLRVRFLLREKSEPDLRHVEDTVPQAHNSMYLCFILKPSPILRVPRTLPSVEGGFRYHLGPLHSGLERVVP